MAVECMQLAVPLAHAVPPNHGRGCKVGAPLGLRRYIELIHLYKTVYGS
jgi:hypothetical protein